MDDFGDEDEEEDIGEEDKEEDIGDEREEDKAEDFVFPSLISEEEDIGEEDKEEKNRLTKQEGIKKTGLLLCHRCQPLPFFRNCYEFRANITVLRSTVYLLRISDYCRPGTVPHLNIIVII